MGIYMRNPRMKSFWLSLFEKIGRLQNEYGLGGWFARSQMSIRASSEYRSM